MGKAGASCTLCTEPDGGQFSLRITANMVTIARIVLMPIPGYLLYGGSSELIAALSMIIVIGLTDWLDGIMARREGPSVLGGLLDPIADKIFIAVIYLPLADRSIVAIWMAACIFARDFVVTALRTSLSLRNAPMRTSTLAKYKTAIQMVGIGYVILYTAFTGNPDSYWVFFFIMSPIALPLSLVIYRLATKKKQGPRSAAMIGLMTFAVVFRLVFGPDISIAMSLYVITGITVVSGFSYIVDAWSALKGTTGSLKEMTRFVVDGVMVPVLFVLLLGRSDGGLLSVAIILTITIELALGGLSNLLASQKLEPKFRTMAIKSLAQVCLAGSALAMTFIQIPFSYGVEICTYTATAITLIYAVVAFWQRRSVYLAAI